MTTKNTAQQDLFTPLSGEKIHFSNRILMAPMTRSRAEHGTLAPNALNALYYSQRASAGLIISEATQISREGQGYAWTPGIYSDDQIQGWRLVTEAVHNAGGKIFCQLWHVGAISHPVFQKNAGAPVSSSRFKPTGQAFVGDKHPEGPQVDFVEARSLKTEEIPRLINDYKHAAMCAQKAGFDGVEIHAANGYLIDQFLRDSVNQRDDQYGGSVENRCRLLDEITTAVLDVWEPGRVGARLSPFGGPGGSSDSDPMKTYTHASIVLANRGLRYLHVVRPNTHTSDGSASGEKIISAMRVAFDGDFIINGEFDAEEANRWISEGKADAVSFGRLFLANPDLPARMKSGGPFNDPVEEDFYGGGAKGYIDYPPLDKVTAPDTDRVVELQ